MKTNNGVSPLSLFYVSLELSPFHLGSPKQTRGKNFYVIWEVQKALMGIWRSKQRWIVAEQSSKFP